MPKKVIKYQCEHCYKKVYASKYRTIAHEKICFFNPEVKSCVTCENALFIENSEEDSKCLAAGISIFERGKSIRNCPYWEEKKMPEYDTPDW